MQPNVQPIKPMDMPFWGPAIVSQGGENHNAVPRKLSPSGERMNQIAGTRSHIGENASQPPGRLSRIGESLPGVSDWFSPVGEQKLEFQINRTQNLSRMDRTNLIKPYYLIYESNKVVDCEHGFSTEVAI